MLIAWFFGVDAEGRSLENIATPLSSTGGSTRFQGATPRIPSSRRSTERRLDQEP
jgi:hypothetical protein